MASGGDYNPDPVEFTFGTLSLGKKKTKEASKEPVGFSDAPEGYSYMRMGAKNFFCTYCLGTVPFADADSHHRKYHRGYFGSQPCVKCDTCAIGIADCESNKTNLTMHLQGSKHRETLTRMREGYYCGTCNSYQPPHNNHVKTTSHDLMPARHIHPHGKELDQLLSVTRESEKANAGEIYSQRAHANTSNAIATHGGRANARAKIAFMVFSNRAKPIERGGKKYLWEGKYCSECICRATGEKDPMKLFAGLCIVGETKGDRQCISQIELDRLGIEGAFHCTTPKILMLELQTAIELISGKDAGEEAVTNEVIS